MIHTLSFADRVQLVFQPTDRGVVGLVDDLLDLCWLYQLRIEFRDGQCYVRRLGGEIQDSLEIPVPKSVFRAALARVAAICNEQRPASVTPYKGEGTILMLPSVPATSQKTVPPSTCYVSYTNTPADQHLEMRFSSRSSGDGNRFTVLLHDKRAVTVVGHELRYVQNTSNQTDSGSYGILSHTEKGEILVALFPISEVIGVFSGEVHDLKS